MRSMQAIFIFIILLTSSSFYAGVSGLLLKGLAKKTSEGVEPLADALKKGALKKGALEKNGLSIEKGANWNILKKKVDKTCTVDMVYGKKCLPSGDQKINLQSNDYPFTVQKKVIADKKSAKIVSSLKNLSSVKLKNKINTLMKGLNIQPHQDLGNIVKKEETVAFALFLELGTSGTPSQKALVQSILNLSPAQKNTSFVYDLMRDTTSIVPNRLWTFLTEKLTPHTTLMWTKIFNEARSKMKLAKINNKDAFYNVLRTKTDLLQDPSQLDAFFERNCFFTR